MAASAPQTPDHPTVAVNQHPRGGLVNFPTDEIIVVSDSDSDDDDVVCTACRSTCSPAARPRPTSTLRRLVRSSCRL
jgi:hypothetical protein